MLTDILTPPCDVTPQGWIILRGKRILEEKHLVSGYVMAASRTGRSRALLKAIYHCVVEINGEMDNWRDKHTLLYIKLRPNGIL